MPKILGGQPPGKIGNADIINHLLFVGGFFFLFFHFPGRTAGRYPKYQSHKNMTDVVIIIKLTFAYIKLKPCSAFCRNRVFVLWSLNIV